VGTSRQEKQWLLRAQCHDREAVELLLRSIQPSLQRYLTGLVGSLHADDVLQEALIAISRDIVWLRAPELFRPWAFRIASRIGFRYLKRERNRLEQPGDPLVLDAAPAPEDRPPDTTLAEVLASNRLSPASQAVLALHFREEMSLAEVAAVLEIPLGTVKSRLAYGLATLRRELGNKGV
jgi:RNA polymerase sigma-70 factor (ECF subfamily)